ncbi:MAG: hypothetical protein ACP5SH_20700 [Syntrophobacteraceae bacterium]
MSKYTRKELYDLVWSEPVTKLAKRFGLSNVGFAKHCRKLDVPLPPRGYWAKKQAGQTPRKTPLSEPGKDYWIEFHERPKDDRPPDPALQLIKSMDFKKARPVPKELSDPHELVRKAFTILGGAEPNLNGILTPKQECLDIRISPEQLQRALRIFDTLIKAVEANGHRVEILDSETVALVDGITLPFTLFEELQRRHLEPGDHEITNWYRFGYNLFYERRFPSGILCLEVKLPRELEGHRHTWRDTDTQKLKDLLNSFIKTVLKYALIENRRVLTEG